MRTMIIIYKDNEDYYDSQLQYLGGAKAAYEHVVSCCKFQGIAVSQKRYTRYEEDMHGDEQITKDITELSFSNTQETVCEYVDTTYEGWGGKNYSMGFYGSKYVIIKPKSEWKAPAPQAPAAQTTKAEPAKVVVLLDQTIANLKTKYHLKSVNTMWRIYGDAELVNTKLYLEKEVLGTLKELATIPTGMTKLKNRLETECGKRFECQYRSEMETMEDGRELHRRIVSFAESGETDLNSIITMISSSIISIEYFQIRSSGYEAVDVYWKKECEDLRIHVHK